MGGTYPVLTTQPGYVPPTGGNGSYRKTFSLLGSSYQNKVLHYHWQGKLSSGSDSYCTGDPVLSGGRGYACLGPQGGDPQANSSC